MTARSEPTVAVVGGGITGLAAAYALNAKVPAARVTLFEKSELGGLVHTGEVAGVPVEMGPDWFVTRNPAAIELCRELGLEGELVPPRTTGTLIWSEERLRKVPANLRGVPLSPREAYRAGLLSFKGAARAYGDLLHRAPLRGPDVSVGAFVRGRFGREVLERLVDPLLAGSRSGTAEEMSLAAAAPDLDALARSGGSILRRVRNASEPADATPFLGLRSGMSSLVDSLRRALSVDFAGEATRLERTEKGLTITSAGKTPVRHEVDAVILAIPPYAAARLLDALVPEVARSLERIPFVDAHVVRLAYPPGAASFPHEASGVLVPSAERRILTAFAWYSEKWAHARPADGTSIVRCFARRGTTAEEASDYIDEIRDELARIIGLRAEPDHWLTSTAERALPIFRVGHRELIAHVERGLVELPRLQLAGAGYRGSGLPDCIADGRRAAEAIAAAL